jgi:GntR family transcriptional regulator/MocR family aminotransferase
LDKPVDQLAADQLQNTATRGRKPRTSKARLLDVISIDRSNSVSIVDQVEDAIRRMITNGALQAGDLLPSTREMARTLQIARTTAMAVLTRLDSQGFVESRRGSGARVRARLTDRPPEFSGSPGVAAGGIGYSSIRHVSSQRRSDIREKLPAHVLLGSAKQVNMQLLSSAAPFAPGMPAIDQFPYREWSEFGARAWKKATPSLLQLRDPAGYRPLREVMAAYLGSARGVRCTPDQVIIVSGAQHAFELCLRVLTEPGDRALIEDPGFLGARYAMQTAGLSLKGISIDEEGVTVPTDAEFEGARLLYTTPSHQYPLGRTMSLSRRSALLEWASKKDCFIFEDDYSSEFRYGSSPLPALQGADKDGFVIYAGTFNKIMFPSLRVGYLVVPEQLLDIFLSVRTWSDSCPPGVIQETLLNFIESGKLYSHIRRMREIYAGRHALLKEMIRVRFGNMLTVVSDAAGLNMAAVANRPIDDLAYFRSALDADIVCPPLSQYFLEKPSISGFQFGFAASNESQMKMTMDRLESIWGKTTDREAPR